MKRFKSLLIALLILLNFALASPALADRPKFLKNPEYIEVTKNLDELLKTKETQATSVPASEVEALQQKIDQLEFQKYALETGINWGQCSNQTGKTLAVYGPKPDFDDDFNYPYNNALYFLADGQSTKNKWDCDGVYIPSDLKTTITNPDGKSEEINGPIVVKIASGTQLVMTSSTGVIDFNIPPTKIVKAGEAEWFIPNIAQTIIDHRVPNAPGVKIANATDVPEVKPAVVESKPQPLIQLKPISLPGISSQSK